MIERLRRFLFSKDVGDWKRRNPFLFALVILTPAVALLVIPSLSLVALIQGAAILIVIAVIVIYLPLKIRYWLKDRGNHG